MVKMDQIVLKHLQNGVEVLKHGLLKIISIVEVFI